MAVAAVSGRRTSIGDRRYNLAGWRSDRDEFSPSRGITGAYTITVIGTAGATTAMGTVTLNVQPSAGHQACRTLPGQASAMSSLVVARRFIILASLPVKGYKLVRSANSASRGME
ncbi:MAG: hypothetical protein WAO35_06965 [Terriglobia bacterium]